MRNKIIAGNWKMHKEMDDALSLIRGVRDGVKASGSAATVDIVLCPPFPFLSLAVTELEGSGIFTGAQNLHEEESGAFTGEVSGRALHSVGCAYVIIGHSERRTIFGESGELVNAKLRAALKANLFAIVCIGETLPEREAGTTIDVVADQLHSALKAIPSEALQNIVLAYEPVWAIGTGKTASPEQAQEVHVHIRALIGEMYSQQAAARMRIQYGGSMKPENAATLLGQPDVDGGLIGGACLESASFMAIIEAAAAESAKASSTE